MIELAIFKVGDGTGDEYDLIYEMQHLNTDIYGEKYEMVTQALANDDFYQGLNMTTVIRRISDGKLFGYQWFDDISKHGEAYIEPNGDKYGFEGYNEEQDNWDTYVSFYVFEPVEKWAYEGYRISD